MSETSDSQNPGWYDAEDVRNAARDRWPGVLAALGVRAELLTSSHGPCPGCGGRDRFRFDDQNGNGTWICSQGGGGNISGDGLALLMHCHGWEWKRAVQEVGKMLLPATARKEGQHRTAIEPGVAPRPVLEKGPAYPPYDPEALQRYVQGTPVIDREWVKARSKLPVDMVGTSDFLEALYLTGERILIFTGYYSQGDFLYGIGSGKTGCRLASERGIKAVESALPTTAKEGIWYLVNPATGNWDKVEKRKRDAQGATITSFEWTRRSEINVIRFPYLVLESDNAPEDLWLRALVKMELPIAAIYSSGGRSLHALVKIDSASKVEFDAVRRMVAKVFCPIGADGGALSAVRLSRLPGCFRQGARDENKRYVRYDQPRLQELVYLNPCPQARSILTLKERSAS